MDIRSIEQVPPSPEHQGTVPVWWLFKPREMREETLGGHLELVSEFEVVGGGEVHPHSHPTFEFYYVLSGLKSGRATLSRFRRMRCTASSRSAPMPRSAALLSRWR
jgi:hypothetical protein